LAVAKTFISGYPHYIGDCVMLLAELKTPVKELAKKIYDTRRRL
jgi:hypothetical protein